MAYTPNWYYAQPINGLVSVTSIEGARAYQLPPNSSMPLFDANEDILYVKTTDAGGFPTLRKFRFEEIKEQPQQEAQPYVTRDELRKELEGLAQQIKEAMNAQQPVQQ